MSLALDIPGCDGSESSEEPLPKPTLTKSKSASPYRKPPPLALSLPDPHEDPYSSFDVSKILPNLLVSSKGVARNFEVLWNMGVRRVVDCNRNEGENKMSDGDGDDESGGCGYSTTTFTIDSSSAGRFPARQIEVMTLNVTDEAKSDIIRCFEPAFKFIRETSEEDGTSCLVHCHSGMSRSCTIAIAYVMEFKNMSLVDAFKFVKDRRRIASPNVGFMSQLIRWRGDQTVDIAKYEHDRFGEVEEFRLEAGGD